METEAKAKVVCLGTIINSIPCSASCFALVDSEEKVKFILFLQLDEGKTASAARNFINSAPPYRRDDLCLCFSLHPSSMDRILGRGVGKFHICVDIIFKGTEGALFEIFTSVSRPKKSKFKQKIYPQI